MCPRRLLQPSESGGDFIDAFVGALRAENSGDEKLERISVVEFAVNVGVGGAQNGENLSGKKLEFGLGRIHRNIV